CSTVKTCNTQVGQAGYATTVTIPVKCYFSFSCSCIIGHIPVFHTAYMVQRRIYHIVINYCWVYMEIFSCKCVQRFSDNDYTVNSKRAIGVYGCSCLIVVINPSECNPKI